MKPYRPIVFVVALLALASLACGSVIDSAVEGAAEGFVEGQVATLEAAAAEAQPTLDAMLTEAAAAQPTVEALLTQGAPTLEAAATELAPVLDGIFVRQWASEATATSQYGDDAWSATQMVGEPNVDGCADSTFAWASAETSTQESVSLFYAQPVVPTQINIYESYYPGSVIKVTVADLDNIDIAVVYEAAPASNETCPNVLTIDISSVTFPVQRVVIDLDQSVVNNWSEIDAVELVGIPLP